MLVYKIRRKSDGLFSTAKAKSIYSCDTNTHFTEHGKIWTKLAYAQKEFNRRIYSKQDYELVTFKLVEIKIEVK